MTPPQRIVAVALHFGDLTISAPPPARHHTLMKPFWEMTGIVSAPDNQGFLTNEGQFVDRRQAKEIAVAARQVDWTCSPLPEFFSEDLF